MLRDYSLNYYSYVSDVPLPSTSSENVSKAGDIDFIFSDIFLKPLTSTVLCKFGSRHSKTYIFSFHYTCYDILNK